MTIRKAKIEDAPEILALMRELIEGHWRLDSYYKKFSEYRNLDSYIKDASRNRDCLLLVAENENEVIAYFIGVIENAPYYSTEKKIGVVSDTAVAPEYRRKGILKMLFSAALDWFAEKGVRYIELSVDVRNKTGVSAWKNLGFNEYKLRMRKEL